MIYGNDGLTLSKERTLITYIDEGLDFFGWRIPVSQYTSIRYTTRLSEVGVMPSVGTVADSYDNAMAEAVTGRSRPS